jgi:hypothetical protein
MLFYFIYRPLLVTASQRYDKECQRFLLVTFPAFFFVIVSLVDSIN